MDISTELTLKNNRDAHFAFSGVTLGISYLQIKPDGILETSNIPTLLVSNNGMVTFTYDSEIQIQGDIIFVIKAEDGQVIGQVNVPPANVIKKDSFTILFDFETVPLAEPNPTANPVKPNFLHGRLLEKFGRQKTEDIQIILLARRAEDGILLPIVAVRTERGGYFLAEYPSGTFVEATAIIGLDAKENPIPIRLESNPDNDAEKIFPRRIVLVVETKDVTKDGKDCDCGCQELDMHKSEMILEEFSYYTLVRTTEPEIKGFVLEDEEEISLEDIIKNRPLASSELIEGVIKLPGVLKIPFNSRVKPSILAPSAIRRALANPSPTTEPGETVTDDFTELLKNTRIKKKVLREFLKKEKNVTKDNIANLIESNETETLEQILNPPTIQPLGRFVLNGQNALNWDGEHEVYQAVSIAHGHLLHFKSEWIADGYSLGDLLYSLPLAPGQKSK